MTEKVKFSLEIEVDYCSPGVRKRLLAGPGVANMFTEFTDSRLLCIIQHFVYLGQLLALFGNDHLSKEALFKENVLIEF